MQSQRRWLRWVLPFAFWSIPPAFIIAYSLHEAKVSAWQLFLTEGLPWYYLAAVTNPIIALAKRYPLETLDRKSTRLNSSHSQISYAVFCLKKKTPCR